MERLAEIRKLLAWMPLDPAPHDRERYYAALELLADNDRLRAGLAALASEAHAGLQAEDELGEHGSLHSLMKFAWIERQAHALLDAQGEEHG